MRAQEFVREDGFTPAQQAAQRAGMGTKAWAKGPPPIPLTKTLSKGASALGKKAVPFVGSVLSAEEAYDRWQDGDRTGAVISALAAAGYLVPGPAGYVLGGSMDMAGALRDAGLAPDMTPGDYKPTQKTMKYPWDRS